MAFEIKPAAGFSAHVLVPPGQLYDPLVMHLRGVAVWLNDDGKEEGDSIKNSDLVVWLTIGHHHVTAAEDFPILSLEPMSFKLKPVNFFDRNPALDLQRASFEVQD